MRQNSSRGVVDAQAGQASRVRWASIVACFVAHAGSGARGDTPHTHDVERVPARKSGALTLPRQF